MPADVTSSPDSGRLLIGCGMHDITGPAAERGMMGYASLFQKTAGIHMRLQSRAFVIESEETGERLAFVSADLCLISQAVKLEVVARLRRSHGDRFTAGNLMISATHTHACPGGYSHHTLYNLSVLGFDKQNFEAIVDGITRSVLRADENRRPGRIKIATGELSGISKNRSLEAYLRNPGEERARYTTPTDDTMTVLRLEAEDGAEIGTINWFAIHGTSLDNRNKLISGDNKGYASYLFEREKERAGIPAFVAAFAQGNEGDISPNVSGGKDGRGPDQFASLERSGSHQFQAARSLYDNADETLAPAVRVVHAFVDMARVTIDEKRAAGVKDARTLTACIGASMLAGTEDGRGVGWEGISRVVFVEWARRVVTLLQLLVAVKPWRPGVLAGWWKLLVQRATAMPADAKVKVIPTGSYDPPWTPSVLPFQLAQVGSLAIAAVPFELTTMAGRRLKRELLESLAPAAVTHVVIAGLANAYAGYVTTREEYALQHYEGASTHFGPWTLAAVQQTFESLARALVAGEEPPTTGAPPPPGGLLVDFQSSVLLDAAPPRRSLGALQKDAEAVYARGHDVVAVACWAGHPKNNLRLEGTFMSVERRNGDTWTEVARDNDPETRFHWRRPLPYLPFSTATAEWRIPDDAEPGTYRVRVLGEGKRLLGRPRPYEARSREFQVQ